ncbi:HEAT repeat domain-containing protein [Aestuariirhabdus litorea]|uniref:HEAT repeat domain-containing protein n=1 Tax=Aestuariirhabdus litorea TaxID=2528527 RepID=A0A3P3VJI8_9GAMM|nr:HEAT repeat domain-containing protein [Aestuariirhabdus litorea]RRJ82885.1 hypothetical protein D0544_13630 [Aestuariirhabdus litorea]RWW93044.1 hypothetical protein DZC74_13605 [Endozoicomonadaceae bacterium GTF-13]
MNKNVESRGRVVARLVRLLQQGDEVDRCSAAAALGELQAVEASGVLVEQLRDQDLDLCIDAAQALGQIGDDSAVAGLLEALAWHGDGEVKLAALQALGRIGSAAALEAIKPLLLERPQGLASSFTEGWDDWWDLQLEAVNTLGELGYQAALGDLEQLLEQDEGQEIEVPLLKAIAQMGAPGVASLQRRWPRASPRTQRRIAAALGHSPLPEAGETLLALLASPHDEVREAALRGLAQRGGALPCNAFLEAIDDPSPAVQLAALEGLQTVGEAPLEADRARQLIASPAAPVRCFVLRQWLAQAGEGASLDVVVNCCNGEEEAVLACQLLAQMGTETSLAVLLAVVNDPARSLRVRVQGIQALAQRGRCEPEVMEALLACAEPQDGVLCQAALRALIALDPAAEAAGLDPSPLSWVQQRLVGAARAPEPTTGPDPESNAEPEPDLIPLHALESVEAPLEPPSLDEVLAQLTTHYPAQEEAAIAAPLGSTLEAIHLRNAEALVAAEREPATEAGDLLPMVEALPPELAEYGALVKHNLGRIRSPGASQPASVPLRVVAAQVLGEAKALSSVPLLLGCLLDDNAELRQQALLSLAEIARAQPHWPGWSEALGPLVTQLNAGSEGVRQAAAQALGALSLDGTRVPLLAALEDSDGLVRLQAIRALVKSAGSDPRRALSPRLLEAIRGCCDDNSIAVRTAVIEALGTLAGRMRGADGVASQTLELIVALGLEEGGAQVSAAAKALAMLDREAASDRLLAVIDGEDPLRRRLAVQVLTLLQR